MNKKMKGLYRPAILMLILVLMCGMLFVLSACDEEEEVEPVYEIRLYDDNWVELAKNPYGSYKNYVVQYDGEQKGINAKVFEDEKEVYTLYYKTSDITSSRSRIRIFVDNVGRDNDAFPYKKGFYTFKYRFNHHNPTMGYVISILDARRMEKIIGLEIV